MERDEGEYAYCGQLVLQLIPPFKAAYTLKLPGTCFVYSLIMLFGGQTIAAIHLGLLIVNCLSIIFLFLIVKRLLNPEAALIACLSFAFLSLSPTVLGFAAHATHFIILPALAGTFLLLFCLENGRLSLYWASGFLFGLAFLMKQQGIFFIFFGFCVILQAGLSSRPVRMKKVVKCLLAFGAGAAIPFMAVLALAWLSGSFDKFWFWTFKYAAKYVRIYAPSKAFEVFQESFLTVTKGFEFLWFTGALGLIVLWLDKRLKNIRWFIGILTICSFLAVCPGFYFRFHYFIVFLPALAILIAIVINYLQFFLSREYSNKYLQYVPLLILLSGIAIGINMYKDYFFFKKPEVLAKEIYGNNPLIESIKIAEYLHANTKPDETIAVVGSEPEIYFYSQRKSATGYIYTYGLMENQDYRQAMQQEMIAEIEHSRPKYLIFIKISTSWLEDPEAERLIFNWFDTYSQRNYQLAGVVDIISTGNTRYIWGDAARTHKIESESYIQVFERRGVSR
ncbi:MAG: glycosyltransferase family 39 protein [Thermodesulfobacteriota bacterium]